MRSLVASVIIVLLLPASCFSVATSGEDPSSITTSNIPNPLAPPSKEFCASNTLGDDVYVSVFLPCHFVFYDTKIKPDHFSCSALHEESEISTEQRKVLMWPDSCVANGPRCYSIEDNPTLWNYTFYQDTEYRMVFPSDATVVSVDCAADFAKVEEFLDNLPEEIEDLAKSIGFMAMVLSIAVLAAIVGCICCCVIGCRGGNRGPRYATYTPVPSHAWKGEPVQAMPYQAPLNGKAVV